MTPEKLDELKKIIDAPDTGSMYAELLKGAIEEVGNEPSHKGFLKVCELATLSYNAGESSAKAIQENLATPVLINYLLDAIRFYQAQDRQEPKAETSKRREFLYLAFSVGGGKGRSGGNTRAPVWDDHKKMEIYEVFSQVFHDAHHAGLTTEKAWRKGYEAAYDHAFKADTLNGRDPKSKTAKANRALLGTLINQHQPRSTIFK